MADNQGSLIWLRSVIFTFSKPLSEIKSIAGLLNFFLTSLKKWYL